MGKTNTATPGSKDQPTCRWPGKTRFGNALTIDDTKPGCGRRRPVSPWMRRLTNAGDLLLIPILPLAAVLCAAADRGLSAHWNEYEQEIAASSWEG